jgi:hypothetical protein
MLNSHKSYYSERSIHGYAPSPLLSIVLLHEKSLKFVKKLN